MSTFGRFLSPIDHQHIHLTRWNDGRGEASARRMPILMNRSDWSMAVDDWFPH